MVVTQSSITASMLWEGSMNPQQPNQTQEVATSANRAPGFTTPGLSTGQPPKMTDEQLRLECVKSVAPRVDPRYITSSAEAVFQYVKNGKVSSSESAPRNAGA